MKIIDDYFLVCADCIQAIVNDDYTGLDYYYNEAEATEREKTIREGIKKVDGHIVCNNENPITFTHLICECCGNRLAGERFICSVLK